MKKRDIEALIIDIRDNSGGYDTYGANLAQYLLAEPFRYFDKIEVTDAFEHEEGEATQPEVGKRKHVPSYTRQGSVPQPSCTA